MSYAPDTLTVCAIGIFAGWATFVPKDSYTMMWKTTALITGTLFLTSMMHDPLPDLKIGDAMPAGDVRMKDVTNKEITLKEVAGKNGLLVVFSCNTCPFVVGSEGSEGWEGRYPALADLCRESGMGMVLVNSNEAKREAGDSFLDMQLRYRAKGYKGYYVLDAMHKVADAFGARTTPHVFLFDKTGKLAYKGAIDDSVESASAVQAHYLNDAVKALVEDRTPDPATTRNLGCSIKRMPHQH